MSTTQNETIAIVNRKPKVWTDGSGLNWTLQEVKTGRIHSGSVLPIELHGHSAVISFGNGLADNTEVYVYNHNRSYGLHTLSYSRLHGHHFDLTAAVFVRDQLDEKDLLERWIRHHAHIGVERFLVYVNSPKAMNVSYIASLIDRFPNDVTFIPFWYGHWVPFGDQQAENMDALWTLKGVSKWMLSIDIDEYVLCKDDLRQILRDAPSLTHAFQLTSYLVDYNGLLNSTTPQYGTLLIGKVIVNTQTATILLSVSFRFDIIN